MRELIFNVFDVLDKICFLLFTDKSVLLVIEEFSIKIKVGMLIIELMIIYFFYEYWFIYILRGKIILCMEGLILVL